MVDFAQLDLTCHDSILCQSSTNQSHRSLSPITQNGTSDLFQVDEPSLSFIDQEERLLPAPMLSLSQMISQKPQTQFCSTPKQNEKRPKSPIVQHEIKKRRILSLAPQALKSSKTLHVKSLKSSVTSRVTLHLQSLHSSVLLASNELVCPSCNLTDNNIRNEELSCRGVTNNQQIMKSSKTSHVKPLKSSVTSRVTSCVTPLKSRKTSLVEPLKSIKTSRVTPLKSSKTSLVEPLKSIKTSRVTPSFKPTYHSVTQKRMFNRRQAKIPQAVIERSTKDVIDVDTCTSKSTEILYWIPELCLTVYDREVLLNPLGWLTDNLINAAQELIKRAFPAVPGLQDVIKGVVFSYDVESGEFIQVVNNHHGHWLTVSTIGTLHPVVNVYDSMYRSVSTGVKATLLHTEAKEITLNFMNVHIQAGGCDCGLFAVANATALAFGHSPGLFQYNQNQ